MDGRETGPNRLKGCPKSAMATPGTGDDLLVQRDFHRTKTLALGSRNHSNSTAGGRRLSPDPGYLVHMGDDAEPSLHELGVELEIRPHPLAVPTFLYSPWLSIDGMLYPFQWGDLLSALTIFTAMTMIFMTSFIDTGSRRRGDVDDSADEEL